MKYTHFILSFIFVASSILSSFAAQTTVEFGQVAQYTEKSDYAAGQMADGTDRTLVIYSGGINASAKLIAADDGYNTTVGATKLGNTTNIGSKLENKDSNGHKKYFIKFSAIKDEQVRLYYFSSSEITTMNTFNLSHTTSAYDKSLAGDEACKVGDKTLFHVDYTIPETGIYYISVSDGNTSISVSGIRFTYQDAGEVIASTVMTGATTFTAGGMYGDAIDKQVKTAAQSSDGKDVTATYETKVGYRLNGAGNYVGVSVNGTTFKEGDLLKIFVTKVPSQGTLAVYGDIAGTDLIYDFGNVGALGTNIATLPAAANGKSVLYVARTSSNTWNGNIYSVEVMRAGIPYEMLFGYTWTAKTDPGTDVSYDLTNYGVLRAGSTIMAVNGASGAMSRSANSGVNMLALNKKDNYIELTTTQNLQAGDEIEIIGYAGGETERGLYIEPDTKAEYFSNSTTALETSKFTGRVLHTSYKATVTEEWLTMSGVTNTIRIFCNGNNIAVEKIEIIRHSTELTSQEVVSGSINGVDLTEARVSSLNTTSSHSISLSEAYHATVKLNVKQVYTLDGNPELTRVVNKEITLGEGDIDENGNTPYVGTVGEITYKVVLKPYTLANVESGRTWNWDIYPNVTAEMTDVTFPAKNTEVVMANITGKIANSGAQNLIISGQYAVTEKNNGASSDKVKCFVGNKVKFNTTISGYVSATWVANGTTERTLTINGQETAVHSSNTTDEYITTEGVFVEAGEVVVMCKLIGGSEGQYFRLRCLKFTPGEAPVPEPEYTTVLSSVASNKIGTICLSKAVDNGEYRGASFYKLISKNNPFTTLVMEEVTALRAGIPYIYVADGGDIEVIYSGDAVAEAGSENGLVGTFTAISTDNSTIFNNPGSYYGISNNTLKQLGSNVTIPAGRAYIDIDAVPLEGAGSPDPVARRFTISTTNMPTDLEKIICEDETVYYDLLGRRLAHPTQSGIYIINGKKVYVKF